MPVSKNEPAVLFGPATPVVEIELLLVSVLFVEKDKAATGVVHPTTVIGLEKRLVGRGFPKEGWRDPLVWFTMCLVSLEAPLRSIFLNTKHALRGCVKNAGSCC
eukprot:Phypoly_transcript_21267.p1 GENE.Phypoly_transcript_21267~~Phypoly_transcript_21267.p1  ORF type:complete len:104 (-),score=8.18 Phypoly_transcript_21267:96-407(-)